MCYWHRDRQLEEEARRLRLEEERSRRRRHEEPVEARWSEEQEKEEKALTEKVVEVVAGVR